ncbi:MAG: response regulator transcription factor [Deltaproteobacteria bacterium]|nr:MAG: response regulator transcription factor [Deltaproteobacteria bacterium]
MAHVLIIDDDRSLLDALAMAFEDAGHDITVAVDGREGLEAVERHRPALVVSDVNMPHVDGFTLTRRLRDAGHGLPIVLLTSRDSEIDEALGLELGADDYVAKPFSTRILLARVTALLRREALASAPVDRTQRLERNGLALDAERLEVRFLEQPIRVTVTEFRLLETLVGRPGVVFSRDALMERMRGDDSVVAERIVDTYIRRLRRKLESIDAEFAHIETVVGAGYRWRDA